jgi:hypothetical protein
MEGIIRDTKQGQLAQTNGELGMPHGLRTVNLILAIPGIRKTIPGIYLASKSPLAYDAL